MTVECIACERFSLRAEKEMAALGFGVCTMPVTFRGGYVSPEFQRQCEHHQPAAADKVEARRAWLAKRQRNTNAKNAAS